MACRVGITTDLARRKQEWQKEYPNLKNWKVLAGALTREKAQAIEDKYAKTCKTSGGGNDPDDKRETWSAYYFEF